MSVYITYELYFILLITFFAFNTIVFIVIVIKIYVFSFVKVNKKTNKQILAFSIVEIWINNQVIGLFLVFYLFILNISLII